MVQRQPKTLPITVFVLCCAQILGRQTTVCKSFVCRFLLVFCHTMHPSDCSSRAPRSVLAALWESLEVSICLAHCAGLYIVQHSTLKLRQTDGRPYGELFTLARTLRKSCDCGKVNDTLPPTKLLLAPAPCLFLLERKSNTASANFNLTLQWKRQTACFSWSQMLINHQIRNYPILKFFKGFFQQKNNPWNEALEIAARL